MLIEVHDFYELDESRFYYQRHDDGRKTVRIPVWFTKDLYVTWRY